MPASTRCDDQRRQPAAIFRPRSTRPSRVTSSSSRTARRSPATSRCRRRPGTCWIVIRPANMTGVPAEGSRMTPAQAAAAQPAEDPRARNAGAIDTDYGAHHYRLVALEVSVPASIANTGLIRLGTSYETTIAQLPHDLVLDRMYIHGTATGDNRRCVSLNGASTRRDRLLHQRLPRSGRRCAGDRRMERTGSVQDRQQLSRGIGREHHVGRRRSAHQRHSFRPTSRSVATTSSSRRAGRASGW